MRDKIPAAVKRIAPLIRGWFDRSFFKAASKMLYQFNICKGCEKMNQQIYLDNAATTKMSDAVRREMEPYLKDCFGNASTSYELGQKSKEALEHARSIIAETLQAKKEEIFFTSGGSESDNWAIKGIAGAKKAIGKHIITSSIEHHAVLNSCEYLERLGYQVTYIKPNEYGIITPEAVQAAIRPDTTLISIMYANNEVGTIEPIAQIGKIARANQILFHTDAVQAYAQLPISVAQLPVDLLSASSHKFHGPKGIGFLYVRDGVNVPSFIHGGGQERGKRAGTENIAGIVGMGKAAELAHEKMRSRIGREVRLRNYMIERVLYEIPDARLNGHRTMRLPGNVSFSFKGVEGASLLMLLEEDGICASGGSACNTGEKRISYVISELSVPMDYAVGTVRLTMCGDTTKEEVDAAIASLKKNVNLLRI